MAPSRSRRSGPTAPPHDEPSPLDDESARREKLAALGAFVSGVAHELNNPLSSIMLFAETMLEEPRSAADVEALTLIRDQARRSRAVVRDLLGYVRGNQGTREIADVSTAIRGALGSVRGEGERLGVRFETAIAADLPVIEIDRAGIEQVLTNLLFNAVQAVGTGGTVRLTARGTGDACELVVEDDGPGIPPDVLPRLFEPFFTTKPAGQGTGLGLPMSLDIVRRHGGSLHAANRAPSEGAGARFTVVIPRRATPASAPAIGGEQASMARTVAATASASAASQATLPTGARPAVGDGPSAGASPTSPRILVIDDEPTIRGAIRRFFTRRQWHVDEAPDGTTALEILLGPSGASYDVIISDIRLPGLTGIELHDRLAAERPALVERLILATGDAGAGPAADLASRARCPIMQKPFELSVLARVVESIRGGAKV